MGRTGLCILTVSFVWRDFSTANWAGSTFYHEVAFVYHTRTRMLLPVYRSKDVRQNVAHYFSFR